MVDSCVITSRRPFSAIVDGAVAVSGSTLQTVKALPRNTSRAPLVSGVVPRLLLRYRGYLGQEPLATTVLDMSPVGDTGNRLFPVAGTNSRSMSRV